MTGELAPGPPTARILRMVEGMGNLPPTARALSEDQAQIAGLLIEAVQSGRGLIQTSPVTHLFPDVPWVPVEADRRHLDPRWVVCQDPQDPQVVLLVARYDGSRRRRNRRYRIHLVTPTGRTRGPQSVRWARVGPPITVPADLVHRLEILESN